MDRNIIFSPPSISELENDILPDPEGYYVGQEDHDYDLNERYVSDNDYDDAYELDFQPDFQYDPY